MTSRRLPGCLLAVALCFLGLTGGGVRGESLVIVQTNIQGAQTSLDVLRSYSWKFTVPTPRTYDSVTAKFTVKRGSNTTAPAVMTLWSTGSSFDISTGTSIGMYSLAPSAASQSFPATPYDFFVDTSAIELYGYYALALTSTAPTPSSQAWFIKGATSSLQFLDGNGQVIADISDNGEVLPVVPEPSTTALLAGFAATAAAAMARRRRQRRSTLRQPGASRGGVPYRSAS